MFQVTTGLNKLIALKKRKKVIPGGTWGGKTYPIIAILMNLALSVPGQKITIVAETIPAVKAGAMAIFIEIMNDTLRWNQNQWNATDRIYRFKNGSSIEFKSFPSVGKAKSAGKRNVIFFNEAQYIPFPIADALMMRTEGDIWIDFNPTNEFWAHTEIQGQDDAEVCKITFKDNEALPVSILKELEMKREKAKTSAYWENWCKVYIDGELGSLQGCIFTNWDTVADSHPGFTKGRHLGYGVDWGFANDPTAIYECFLFEGEYYERELLYKTGMHDEDVLEFVHQNMDINAKAVADSSAPKTIDWMRKHGWKGITEADRSRGTVISGINQLQSFTFHTAVSSLNLIDEHRKYMWDVDKSGKVLNDPIDAFNHLQDGRRYLLSVPGKKKLYVGSSIQPSTLDKDRISVGNQKKDKPLWL